MCAGVSRVRGAERCAAHERGGGGAAEHAQLHSLRTQGLSQRMLRVRFCTVRGSVIVRLALTQKIHSACTQQPFTRCHSWPATPHRPQPAPREEPPPGSGSAPGEENTSCFSISSVGLPVRRGSDAGSSGGDACGLGFAASFACSCCSAAAGICNGSGSPTAAAAAPAPGGRAGSSRPIR